MKSIPIKETGNVVLDAGTVALAGTVGGVIAGPFLGTPAGIIIGGLMSKNSAVKSIAVGTGAMALAVVLTGVFGNVLGGGQGSTGTTSGSTVA
jgi:hypothetical protein